MSAYWTAISELSRERLIEECLRQHDRVAELEALVERLKTEQEAHDHPTGLVHKSAFLQMEARAEAAEAKVERLKAKLEMARKVVDYYADKPEPLGSYEQIARDVANELRAILAAKKEED